MKRNEQIRKKKTGIILAVMLVLMMFIQGGYAQTPNSVGIGTTNPDNSAVLHLESSNQGFLMTRMTTPQISAITAPTVGLIIYNTTDQCYWYKRPTYWARLCNTDSINAASVITNTFHSDTSYTNVNNFGNGYGDSIWVHYADIDTAVIHHLTVQTINADSIYLGGNSITTVITDSITRMAWLLLGNTGTNPSINFLGTKDNADLAIRTNNTEKLRVTAPGNVGIGTPTPHNSALLELKGTDKGFLMTRLSTAQITAIPTPTIGLITYNTDDNCYWYKHPYGWKRICNTDSLGNIFINTLTTNTVNATTVNTSTIISGTGTFTNITTNTITTNVFNFGNGYGDSIFVHYAQIDTAVIHSLTATVIHGDSIYLGGQSITTVITDSITHMAWLLLGNTGTNPAINFLGTKDNQDLVFRTNNTEKMRVTNTGSVGIGTNAPTAKVEVIGNTKTTNFQMTSGAANTYILQSNAVGSGSWTPPASVVSVLTPTVFNTNAWTLLGNSGTNPAINFLGTTDNQRLVFRTNNTEKATILANGDAGFGTPAPVAKVDVAGKTRTTTFQMTTAPVVNYVMTSDAAGNGSWNNISSVLTATALNGSGWTILGNTGTNPATNFLGTIDNQDMVIRTNNTEKVRVTALGNTGFGVPAPTNRVEVAGNTKTTNFQMTAGAASGYVLQSDAVGSGSWTPLAAMVSTLAPTTFSANAWTLLGNAGTNPAVNFVGTSDNQRLVFRTNNTEKVTILANGDAGFGTPAPVAKVDVAGTTRTTNFQMTSGAALDYILKSDAAGTASWTPLAAMVATLAPATFNANAWTLLGNAGTTSTVNFVGTKDAQDLTFRTNNVQRFKITTTGQFQAQAGGSITDPSFSWGSGTGFYIGGGQIQVGHTNYNVMTIGGNLAYEPSSFAAASNTIVGPAVANVVLGGNNKVQNTIFNMVIGRNNTYVNPHFNYNQYGNNVMIGNMNTINNEVFYCSLMGLGNTITGAGIAQSNAFGTQCQLLHSNATAIGYLAKTFAGSCVAISGPGGVNAYSNNINTTGVALAPGGGAWAAVSDRRLKENINEISNKAILQKILSVPVTEWTYLSQKVDTMNKYAPVGVRYDKAPVHIGPMAQDFSEVFGYGEFKDKITSSDIDGVMFSGIQALAEENKELKAKIEKLEAVATELEALKKIVNELKNR